jgi:hypothetical protein
VHPKSIRLSRSSITAADAWEARNNNIEYPNVESINDEDLAKIVLLRKQRSYRASHMQTLSTLMEQQYRQSQKLFGEVENV